MSIPDDTYLRSEQIPVWAPSVSTKVFDRCSVFETQTEVYVVGYDSLRKDYGFLTFKKNPSILSDNQKVVFHGENDIKEHDKRVEYTKSKESVDSFSPDGTTLIVINGGQHLSKQEIVLQLRNLSKLPAFHKVVDGYGIVGTIELFLGHYLIVITKRKKVGTLLGCRRVYTIEGTLLVPCYNASLLKTSKPDMFQAERNKELILGSSSATWISSLQNSVALSDDTSTLLATPTKVQRFIKGITEGVASLTNLNRDHPPSTINLQKEEARYKELLSVLNLNRHFYFSYTHDISCSMQWNFIRDAWSNTKTECEMPQLSDYIFDGDQLKAPFFWNFTHTEIFRSQDHLQSWIIPIIHGYFGYARYVAEGLLLDIALIARRSRYYAGTRYRKRGVDETGHAANDVETEQVLFDAGATRHVFSFVQSRASVPIFWSQEANAMVPKPPILFTKLDPTFSATRRHFEDLLCRHGSPILAVNLMKTSKNESHAAQLATKYREAVQILNEELPEAHHIQFCEWNIKAAHKLSTSFVDTGLTHLSDQVLTKTGYFHASGPHTKPLRIQKGALRTNCVDCLDRTNVAQFFAGRGFLGHQLLFLGYVEHIPLQLNASITLTLSDMYDSLGDQLALQYGGSVTHKKFSRQQPLVLRNSKEFLTSIQRHYANAFADFERQTAMNVFLGLVSCRDDPWSLEKDVWAHRRPLRHEFKRREWWKNPLAYFTSCHQILDCLFAHTIPCLRPRLCLSPRLHTILPSHSNSGVEQLYYYDQINTQCLSRWILPTGHLTIDSWLESLPASLLHYLIFQLDTFKKSSDIIKYLQQRSQSELQKRCIKNKHCDRKERELLNWDCSYFPEKLTEFNKLFQFDVSKTLDDTFSSVSNHGYASAYNNTPNQPYFPQTKPVDEQLLTYSLFAAGSLIQRVTGMLIRLRHSQYNTRYHVLPDGTIQLNWSNTSYWRRQEPILDAKDFDATDATISYYYLTNYSNQTSSQIERKAEQNLNASQVKRVAVKLHTFQEQVDCFSAIEELNADEYTDLLLLEHHSELFITQ